MARREIYKCDACGVETESRMHDVGITVMYGTLCLSKKHLGDRYANKHVCRGCASNIVKAVENALDESLSPCSKVDWRN